MYVADQLNNRISVFQSDGKFYNVIGGKYQMSEQFDIAINVNNEILVADWGHHCIYVFTLDGQYTNEITKELVAWS